MFSRLCILNDHYSMVEYAELHLACNTHVYSLVCITHACYMYILVTEQDTNFDLPVLILEKLEMCPSWLYFSLVLVRDLDVGKAGFDQGGFLPWGWSYWEEREIATRILLLYRCQNTYDLGPGDWMVGHYGTDEYTC